MTVTNESTVVSFDVEGALEAVRDTISDPLYSFIEFDPEAFNPLYIDDRTLSFYEDTEHMHEHFGEIHSYASVDFTEIELFTDDLFPVSDRVEYIATRMDYLKLLRVYVEREGVFMALDSNEPVDPVADAFDEAVRNGADG